MYQIFIPTIEVQQVIQITPEQEFIKLLFEHPDQKHKVLVENKILTQLAQQRANDLATRNYIAHVDLNGIGPNHHATCLGYKFPSYYGHELTDNNIESIEAGSESAQDAFTNLINEIYHRQHLLGEIDFYAEQTEFGIARAYNQFSDFKYYWVIEIAKPN